MIKENNELTSSDKYLRKSNRMIMLIGVAALVVFFVGIMFVISSNSEKGVEETDIDLTGSVDPFAVQVEEEEQPLFEEDALNPTAMVVTPTVLTFDAVTVGGVAEGTVTIMADSGKKVKINSFNFEDLQAKGFEVVDQCSFGEVITGDASCDVIVVWRPTEVAQIQTNMTISWMEEDSSLPIMNKTLVVISANSVDSACVSCEGISTGKGTVKPEIIAIDFRNAVIGTVNASGEVLDGETVIGSIIGDGSVILDGKVEGRVINLGSAIDGEGRILGTIRNDGTVFDMASNPIGTVRFDGSVIDVKGAEIGYVLPRGVVISATGSVVGEVNSNGKVVDSAGVEVANILPDGSAVLGDIAIGNIVPTGVAVANGCRFLGEIQKDGTVVDDASRLIGNVLASGAVVDTSGNAIGAVVKQGLVVGDKGEAIGFVSNDGKVTDNDGNVVACMSPQGKAVSLSDGAIVGGLVPHTGVVGPQCSRVGFVFPNGNVISGTGEVVGKITASGDVVDDTFNKIGSVVSSSTNYAMNLSIGYEKEISGTLIASNYAIGNNCTVVGKVDAYGRIYNEDGVEIACLSDNFKFTEPTSGNEVQAALLNSNSVFDMTGKFLGLVNKEGKLAGSEGRIIGCVNSDLDFVSDGKVTGLAFEKLIGDRNNSAVIDNQGNLLGYVGIDGSVIDALGASIGKIVQTGTAVGNNGLIIGRVVPKGIAVSFSGRFLGSTDSNGRILDAQGNLLGSVLRDDTVISSDGKVVGKFFKENSVAISIEGEVIGRVNNQGRLMNSADEEIGTLRADGMIVDSTMSIIGGVMPTGYAVDSYGNVIGKIADDASVIDGNNLVGQVLLNGTVINRSLNAIGQVLGNERILIDNKGDVAGTVLADGSVINRFFEKIGTSNASGTVFDADRNIIGGAIKEGLVIDNVGNVQGYVNLNQAYNFSGAKIGNVLNNSLVIDTQDRVLGVIVSEGIGVDYNGRWLGTISNKGTIINGNGELIATLTPEGYLRDINGSITGKKIENGYIASNTGLISGILMPDASVLLKSGSAEGNVLPNGAALSLTLDIIGSVIPYNSLVLNNYGQTIGVMGYNNTLAPVGNSMVKGTALSNYLVVDGDTNITSGSIARTGDIAIDLSGALLGYIMADGSVVSDRGETLGHMASGGATVDKYGKVIGGKVTRGVAVSNDGALMGQVAFDGSVTNSRGGGASFVTPAGKITDGNRVLGSVVAEDIVASSSGRIMGLVNTDSNVRDFEGNVVGKVWFDGIIADGNGNYLGGLLPTGLALTENGAFYGYVGRDGYVSTDATRVIARSLPDGSVAAVNNKANYAVVPTVSYVVKPGAAVVAKGNKYAGFAFPDGVVVDEYGKNSGTTNRFSIVSPEGREIGPVVNLDTAMGQSCRAVGLGDASGSALDISTGMILGKILSDFKVNGPNNDTLGGIKVQGSVFDRNCKQIGYVSPDGSVVDLRGRSIGCVNYNRQIVNVSGGVIGLVAPERVVKGLEGKIHKVLFNGQVLDDAGVTIGCLQVDNTVINSAGDIVDTLQQQTYYMGGADTATGSMPTGNYDQPTIGGPMSGGEALAYGVGAGGIAPVSAADPVALAALQAAQQSRRNQMGMSTIKPSKSMLKKAMGVQDWTSIGIDKNIMSNPVAMNRVILKGKAIPAVLTRSVDSRFPVPLEAHVDRNIYAEDGREILIPSGSKLIGSMQASGGGSNMVPKLSVSWERLIRPDGASFAFSSAVSGDSQGRGGVPGYLDMQLLKRYGLPLLETVLTSAITYGMAAWDDSTPATVASDTGEVILSAKQQAAQDARDEFRDGMEQIFQSIISETSQIPTVVFIPSGTRITVFANEDLWIVPSHWDEEEDGGEEAIDDIPLGGAKSAKNKTGSTTSSSTSAAGGGGVSYQPAAGAEMYQGASSLGGPPIVEPVYVPSASQTAAPVYVPPSGGDTSTGGSPAPRLF